MEIEEKTNAAIQTLEHVNYIDEKASVTQEALARMMIYIRGPGLLKRRIILAIVTSVMLYTYSIWSEAIYVQGGFGSVYRLSAIRRINGFRTVSDEAVLIDILVDEMRSIYFHFLEYPRQITTIKAEGNPYTNGSHEGRAV